MFAIYRFDQKIKNMAEERQEMREKRALVASEASAAREDAREEAAAAREEANAAREESREEEAAARAEAREEAAASKLEHEEEARQEAAEAEARRIAPKSQFGGRVLHDGIKVIEYDAYDMTTGPGEVNGMEAGYGAEAKIGSYFVRGDLTAYYNGEKMEADNVVPGLEDVGYGWAFNGRDGYYHGHEVEGWQGGNAKNTRYLGGNYATDGWNLFYGGTKLEHNFGNGVAPEKFENLGGGWARLNTSPEGSASSGNDPFFFNGQPVLGEDRRACPHFVIH